MRCYPQSKPALQAGRAAAVMLLSGIAVSGCGKRPTGSGAPGDLVDSSWVTAAESCWPDLIRDGYHARKIEKNLAVPPRFRSTFPSYSAQSDQQIRALLTRSLGSAPVPDISRLTHSQTPVLTRRQAAAGTSPQAAVAANTQAIAPPDALCAIQTGTPAGFR
jgi:hypothetical protein